MLLKNIFHPIQFNRNIYPNQYTSYLANGLGPFNQLMDINVKIVINGPDSSTSSLQETGTALLAGFTWLVHPLS